MTPAEAGAVELEEPNWRERFEEECGQRPTWPRYLQEAAAFEEVLRQWRVFHATPIEVDGEWKRKPAGAGAAMAALVALRIMPPRSEYQDIPRGGPGGYQQDDHMWLSIAGEQWRITAIEDRILFLEKMNFGEKLETKQIDLNRARWDKYTEMAVEVLEAMRNCH